MIKIVKILDANLHGSLPSMIRQQVTLLGDAEWPKVADAVIEAKYSPELNCIEILWRFIKYEWIELAAYKSWAHLVDYVENVLQNFGAMVRQKAKTQGCLSMV